MISLSVVTAFIAGLGSFFAPCVVPLIPVYVGYVLGLSSTKSKKALLYAVLLYILGFSLVFTLLGAAAGGLGSILREHTRIIQIIGGIAMIIFGLEFLGILRISLMAPEKGPKIPHWANNIGVTRSFVVGVLFALTWTPCVGAALGAILSLAATSRTAVEGAGLLFIYSLGISLPFVIVAWTLSSAPKYIRLHKKFFVLISKTAGVILVIFGLLLLSDTYKYLNMWVLNTI